MAALLMQVIVTDLERRGKGIPGDPIRRVRQYWSTEGDLLAEWDEFKAETLQRSIQKCLDTAYGLPPGELRETLVSELKKLDSLVRPS